MAAYVGLDPRTDIDWVENPAADAMRLFTEGKIDGFIGFPPEPQELRAKKVGHVVVNTLTDRPWSQYFCCMLGANREFVRKHPVATKRAVRAILKANDLCAREPERVAAAVRAIVRAQGILRKEPARATEVGRRRFPPTAAAIIAAVVERDLPFYDPAISDQAVAAMNGFARSLGLMAAPVAYEDVVATRFRSLWAG